MTEWIRVGSRDPFLAKDTRKEQASLHLPVNRGPVAWSARSLGPESSHESSWAVCLSSRLQASVRMLKSKCDGYCHNRQVPRIHVRNYVCDAMYVKGEIMQLKPHRKSSVSAAFLTCIAWRPGVCASIQGQEDAVGKKPAASEAQNALIIEKG